MYDSPKFDVCKNDIPQMFFDFSWIMLNVLVSPEINDIGFEAQGHVQKPRHHRNEGFSASPIIKSKSYKSEMKQNNYTELLALSFP